MIIDTILDVDLTPSLFRLSCSLSCRFFFFFNDTATTEIYTLSLHDALPISSASGPGGLRDGGTGRSRRGAAARPPRTRPPPTRRCRDRKSTRLNSSHGYISYAVFCLKKKKKKTPR